MYFKAVSALCVHRKESLVLDLRPQLSSAGSLQPYAQAEIPYMGKKKPGFASFSPSHLFSSPSSCQEELPWRLVFHRKKNPRLWLCNFHIRVSSVLKFILATIVRNDEKCEKAIKWSDRVGCSTHSLLFVFIFPREKYVTSQACKQHSPALNCLGIAVERKLGPSSFKEPIKTRKHSAPIRGCPLIRCGPNNKGHNHSKWGKRKSR